MCLNRDSNVGRSTIDDLYYSYWYILLSCIILNHIQTTTIKELYQEVCERTNTKLINAWLWSSNVVLPSDSDETLEDYHIGANSNIVFVQRVPGGACRAHYQINNRKIDGSVRLSANKCVLLWVDDDTISKRVEMPCGHAVTPDGLADYIYTEVINQKTKIICPVKSCNAEWKVFEIIKRGLTAKERENLEKGIAKNNLHAQGVQECLQCSAYIQREGNGTRVECLFCKQTGNKYEFCWSCQKRWKNNDSYSNCGNIPCDPDAEFHKILHTCSTKELYGVNVPEVRACPHCNKGINHKEKCKHMECPSCDTKFCFICLSVKSGSKWLCGSYDSACSVAPRQKMVNY